jgi:HdeA/HdeB family protein
VEIRRKGREPAKLEQFHETRNQLSASEEELMRKTMLLGFSIAMATIGAAKADPVPLSSYADANGFIDVQALTCGQLANTYQEDANALTTWYSGWYNGLAHKHYADFKKGREVEHQVIEYCKAHPNERIIHAIGLMLREDRAEGMMMEK